MTDDSNAIIEVSARLCYMSFGRGRRDIADFIHNLLSSKDGSVFEHVNYGFVFTGVSRSLTHELVRHRAGFAYSQRSQRYVDETEGSFVLPPARRRRRRGRGPGHPKGRDGVGSRKLRQAGRRAGDRAPQGKIRAQHRPRKAIRQAARAVLPNATETKIFVTGNVRAWRHFIEMRAAPFADWEIRSLALQVLNILQRESPIMFGDFEVSDLPDGTQIAVPEYSGLTLSGINNRRVTRIGSGPGSATVTDCIRDWPT